MRDRLQSFVDSGKLGIFANGYWGHPAMKLPPEVNLLAASHYLQALEVQRKANKIVTILGRKTPNIQNLAVGGVANAINLDSQSTLNMDRLYAIKELIDEIGDFVNKVYDATSPRSARSMRSGRNTAPASPITCRCRISRSTPRGPSSICPAATSRRRPVEVPADQQLPGRLFPRRRQRGGQALLVRDGAERRVASLRGETTPKYDEFQDDGKYSWVKAPRFDGKRAQVGPLAQVLGMSPPATSRPSGT